MPVEIQAGAQIDAPATDSPTAAPTTMLIDGKLREVKSVTIGGKTVVYTDFLTVSERMRLSRAMPPNDVSAVEAYGFNQVAGRVRSVDGFSLGFPAKPADIDSNIAQIGDDIAEFLFEDGNARYAERREARAKNFLTTAVGA